MRRKHVLGTMLILAGMMSAMAYAACAGDIPEHLAPYWGRDMTASELLRATDPGSLSLLPRNGWDTPVTWGGNGQMHARPIEAETEMEPGPEFDLSLGVDSVSTDSGAETESLLTEILVNCTYKFTTNGLSVYHGASNTVAWPLFYRIPYMFVATYLMENGFVINCIG